MRAWPQRDCNLLANSFDYVRTCEEQFLRYLKVAAADTALGKVGSRMERAVPAYEKVEKALRVKKAAVAAAVRSASEQKSIVEAQILLKKKDMSSAWDAKAWTHFQLASSEVKVLQKRLRDLRTQLVIRSC